MYETQHRGVRVAFFYPGLGAPAAATCMEEAIAMGCRDFIAVGGAGALVPNLDIGHAVVVDSAVRDEGTSFHYLAPSRTVDADETATQAIVAALEAAEVAFVRGRSWATDAIYRETRGRVSNDSEGRGGPRRGRSKALFMACAAGCRQGNPAGPV